MNRRARQFHLLKSNVRGSTPQSLHWIYLNFFKFVFLSFWNLLSTIHEHLSHNIKCLSSLGQMCVVLILFHLYIPCLPLKCEAPDRLSPRCARFDWLILWKPIFFVGRVGRSHSEALCPSTYSITTVLASTQTCTSPHHWPPSPLSDILLPACKNYKAVGVKTTCLNSTPFAWPADSPQGH